jgi:hypothetical protein
MSGIDRAGFFAMQVGAVAGKRDQVGHRRQSDFIAP